MTLLFWVPAVAELLLSIELLELGHKKSEWLEMQGVSPEAIYAHFRRDMPSKGCQ